MGLLTTSYNPVYDLFYQLVTGFVSDHYVHIVTTIILLIAVTILLGILDFIFRKILLSVAKSYILRTKSGLDDIVVKNKLLDRLVHLFLMVIARGFLNLVFESFPILKTFTNKTMDCIIIVIFTLLLHSVFKCIRDFARTNPKLADKPLDSYHQVVIIILYFFSGIIIFSILTGESPITFLVSLGAASAILMLVFKDTIMGFVASIQVSTNDMVRVGDWIEMMKHGADGTVIEINLSTVKVQNFDKTITTIPTHLLIADSFKNYRGMHNSGGRRIKRHINIKMSSIRFLTQEEISELSKIKILAPYIEKRIAEIEEYNKRENADTSMLVNGRRMTNIGLFRNYVILYAQQNPNIHKEHMLLVRQLQPNEHGMPLELYMFTNDTVWAFYETVMADIFDHLLASIKSFKLEVFELPASDDLRSIRLKE